MKNKSRLADSISQDELIYLHWMVEFVELQRDVKKEYLDEVIDPKKLKLTKEYMEGRIKDLQ